MAHFPKTSIVCSLFISVFFVISAIPAHAKIAVTEDPAITGEIPFGTLIVNYADGSITLIDSLANVPEVRSGARIEVFDGHATISTEEGDTATAACFSSEFAMGSGSSVTVVCREDSGLIEVKVGIVTYKDEKGNIVTIKAGEKYPIKIGKALTEEKPEATGAGADQEGFTATDEIAPPDSRGIQSSPST